MQQVSALPDWDPRRPDDFDSPRTIIERAVETAREMLGMEMAYIADTRSGEQAYKVVAGDGASFGARADASVPLAGTYCEAMLDGRLENIVADSASHPLASRLPITSEGGIASYIGVPMILPGGETYGTFCCLSHEPNPRLRERDVQFMVLLGRLIVDQVVREQRLADLRGQEVLDGTVRALLASLAARDGYTEDHSQRVVQLADQIGQRLGLDESQLAGVRLAALLHDIGKLGVADAILHKPGPLDEQEWVEMRRHPEIGEKLVAAMPSLAHLAPIVRADHERWDGRGYPDGLAGESIPVAARVVFVADAFHAMTSDRPYRRGMSTDVALAELSAQAGTQFWPQAVEAAIACVRALSA